MHLVCNIKSIWINIWLKRKEKEIRRKAVPLTFERRERKVYGGVQIQVSKHFLHKMESVVSFCSMVMSGKCLFSPTPAFLAGPACNLFYTPFLLMMFNLHNQTLHTFASSGFDCVYVYLPHRGTSGCNNSRRQTESDSLLSNFLPSLAHPRTTSKSILKKIFI